MADGDSFDRRPDRAPAPRRAGDGGTSGLMAEIKRVPLWVWPIAAIVVFFVVRAFLSNQASSTATTDTTDTTDTSGTATTGSSGDASSGDQNGAPPTNPDLSPPSGAVLQRTTIPDQGFISPPSSRQPAPSPSPSPPAPTPAPKPPTPAPKPSTIHVVQSGETLNEIAAHYGVSEPQLYNTNVGVIESTARAHGMPSSHSGWWIFPGERLAIP